MLHVNRERRDTVKKKKKRNGMDVCPISRVIWPPGQNQGIFSGWTIA
jgi:hypothetical protein